MRIANRKFAITGAGRGLGAALAIKMADAGAQPILLARSTNALPDIQAKILERTGQQVDTLVCDLADSQSASAAGETLARQHSDLDGIIHNGAMWLSGSMSDISDHDIESCIASSAIGSLLLTRHLLPILKERDNADIHTVVSTSGLPNQPLDGGSVVFTAAKSAQAGFVQGLSQELKATNVRVTAVFPGDFVNVSPDETEWDHSNQSDHTLRSRLKIDPARRCCVEV